MLDHSVEWFYAMIEQLSKADFENNINELVLHGADKAIIDKMRAEYDRQFGVRKKKPAPLPSLAQFKMMGLSVGKPNKTKVVR